MDWDVTTDTVIVGSGGGALCGALVARARGLDVFVLEKTELIGGSTAMSGGGVWVPNSPVMRAHDVPDSEADALAYLDAVVGDAGPASSPERRRAFIENAPRMMAFLQEQGIVFEHSEGYVDYYGDYPGANLRSRTHEAVPFDTNTLGPWKSKLRPGQTAALGLVGSSPELTSMSFYNTNFHGALVGARVLSRTARGKLKGQALVANGAGLVGAMLRRALENGAQVWTEAPVTELVLEDGAVIGVVARREGTERRVRARHGVLLAAGGFARNEELRARYSAESVRTARWSGANPGDTGEVLQMAMAIGAATDLLDAAIWLPMQRMSDGSPPSPTYPIRRVAAFSRARWRPGTIIVDSSGRRYANESTNYMEFGKAILARHREVSAIPSWLIFDDAFRRRSLFGVVPGRLPEQWVTDGFVRRDPSAAGLAGQIGIDPEVLKASLEQFNSFARAGVDADFHRGESPYDRFMGDPGNRPNRCLAPLERAPYYAAAIYPSDIGTCGGVLTDERARVLDTRGEPIPGLYGTGNVTAGVMGRGYAGAGASIGPTCTFGFVAVNDMAARAEASPRDG
jgi:3-oxosteroid 1-dehydrogenase